MNTLSFFDNTAQVYVIEADDFIKPDVFDLGDYLSILSEEEKERFNRYKNEKAQFTFLTARVYLRVLLSCIISKNKNWIATQSSTARNDDLSSLIIETTPSGKPYLKDYPTLFFNISHTSNLILIGIANSPIGVDVEKIDRNADKDGIIKHFFSEKEQQSFFSQPENKKELAFVKGWTRKEAILKATGEGLSSMKNYEVSFEPETYEPLIFTNSNQSFNIKDFIPSNGYVACIALFNKKLV